MKQPTDSFFRERLEQHSMPAPVNAWSRIEKEMNVAQPTYFLWKVAAAILLLLVSIALLLPGRITQQESSTLSLVTPAAQTPVQKEKVSAVKKESPLSIEATEHSEKNTRQIKPVSKTISTSQLHVAEETTLIEEVTLEQEQAIAIASATDLPTETIEVLPEKSVQPLSSSVLEERTTIVIAASEVNQKYLRASAADQATRETETTSSFRKLIDKAAAFKNNSSGLAELRQKKNELLAVNTDKIRNRNEKTERNN